jgi:chemotaxis protein histidine kinase CheA
VRPERGAAAEREEEDREKLDSKIASQSIRVNVETLENLMTMVSELVLTRNQLLEIVRRHQESEFKVPLQRLSNVTAELQEGVMKTRMQPIGMRGRNCRGSCAISLPNSAKRSNWKCTAPTPNLIDRSWI